MVRLAVLVPPATIGAVRLVLPFHAICGSTALPLLIPTTEPMVSLSAALRIDILISEAEVMQIFNATKSKYGL